MQKFILGFIAIIGLFTITAVSGVSAAPELSGNVGPFEGTFNGMVYGNNGTSAPFSLVMTHRGDVVSGTAFVGEGLFVDGGICGSAYVPATAQAAGGVTSGKGNQLDAKTTFNIEGMPITVDLESTVVGGVIDAEAKIDLPWFCGSDPVLSASLTQVQ
jgi:hypothetical protein